jgi:hypothetical protein
MTAAEPIPRATGRTFQDLFSMGAVLWLGR